MKTFGIDYPVLEAANPRIIYAAISFCGDEDFLPGPYSGRLGTDPVAQAMAGLLLRPTGNRPVRLGISLNDCLAPTFLTIGILEALLHRRASGHGQRLDVTLYDVGVASQLRSISKFSGTGEAEPPGNEGMPFPSGVFGTKDGFVVLDTTWPDLCRAMGRPELASTALPDHEGGPGDANTARRELVEGWLAEMTKHEASDLLNRQGICAAPVQTIQEVMVDPHLQARRMLVTIPDPAWGEVEVPGNPIKGFAAQAPPSQPPSLGADGRQVLAEILGLDPAALDALVDGDAVAV
jgi:crotonobetainyl-CoA:carnitine CoA-transferase CaiB-like acyl-CoA transferase